MPDENDGTSIVQRPRDYSDIIKLGEKTAWEEFLDNLATQALEAFTGALSLGVKQAPLAAGRMAQAIVKGRMYEQMANEWKTLREAGKIPDNLGDAKHGLYTWAELIKIIDDECPDEDRLDALKAIFYAVNKLGASDAEQIQAYQLWRITKELDSADLLLLKAAYEIARRGGLSDPHQKAHLQFTCGLGFSELFDIHVKRLKEKRLFNDMDGAIFTDMGRHLCRNIETYKIDIKAAKEAKTK